MAAKLPSQQTARFYRIWFVLLHFVNEQLHLVPAFPAVPPDEKVLQAFRKHLAQTGLSVKMVELHASTIQNFASTTLLSQTPSRGLHTLSSGKACDPSLGRTTQILKSDV